MASASSVDTPHFSLPLRYVNGSAQVNQQGSLDDIVDCIYAVCVTNPGDRDELPDFGLLDMTFDQEPLPTDAAVNQITQWEPRASVVIDAAPDRFDEALVNANVNVSLLQTQGTP
jgi:phage baseplate assembly protein W